MLPSNSSEQAKNVAVHTLHVDMLCDSTSALAKAADLGGVSFVCSSCFFAVVRKSVRTAVLDDGKPPEHYTQGRVEFDLFCAAFFESWAQQHRLFVYFQGLTWLKKRNISARIMQISAI